MAEWTSTSSTRNQRSAQINGCDVWLSQYGQESSLSAGKWCVQVSSRSGRFSVNLTGIVDTEEEAMLTGAALAAMLPVEIISKVDATVAAAKGA